MTSLLPTIVVLGIVAFAAAQLAWRRSSTPALSAQRVVASRILVLATLVQSTHFAEELSTSFHVRFPALFGLEPMSLEFFVSFNVTWIVIWIVSAPLLRSGQRIAFFTAWFLAIAGMLNGLAHPLMALASGGYFPGLVTSPAIGLAGFVLWRSLARATASQRCVRRGR